MNTNTTGMPHRRRGGSWPRLRPFSACSRPRCGCHCPQWHSHRPGACRHRPRRRARVPRGSPDDIRVARSPDELDDEFDTVYVCVKSYDSSEVAETLALQPQLFHKGNGDRALPKWLGQR